MSQASDPLQTVRPAPGAGRLARLRARLLNPRTVILLPPYVWLLLFFLAPFAIVLKLSISEAAIAMPPYLPIFEWAEGLIPKFTGTLYNFTFLFTDDLYIVAYLNSIKIAAISTFVCLLIGYPMAYGIARAPGAWRNALLMLVILPFWTSFLIRVYAWIGILKNNGILNNLLISLGIIDQPIQMLHNDFSVYVGIVYSYLPFMILPLYANLAKMDESLLEAAADLGCRPWKAFWSVTLPLSLPGIVAGSMLVFIPAVGEFVIPELLGGPDTLMIGRILWNEFFHNRDWPVASAVAIAMLIFLVIPIVIFQHYQNKDAEAQK
ncbi:MAG: ABC transporter permease subunit [Marivibrio sp.]|uniref:ABC transporter permease subunit n=1 Tax=Marivibrio sp. TaxID=2039719 RepID=UPI0032EF38A4